MIAGLKVKYQTLDRFENKPSNKGKPLTEEALIHSERYESTNIRKQDNLKDNERQTESGSESPLDTSRSRARKGSNKKKDYKDVSSQSMNKISQEIGIKILILIMWSF